MVEEKFADYEKDRRSHVDSDLSNGQIKSPLEYTFTSLDVSSGDTVSVAFFIYTTDSQGVRTAEVRITLCDALLSNRCFDELFI